VKTNIRRDRFGNETMVIGIKIPSGKEYGRGFVEIAGKLFKVEVSGANKEGYQAWVKMTKLEKRKEGGAW